MTTYDNQFGLMIAYLLPGFIGLGGLVPFVPIVAGWLRAGSYGDASLGPPVYAILAATTIGMIASCFRWLILDHILHWTGVVPPVWNDARLEQRLGAFKYLVESHYRYYQFVANSAIVLIAAYLVNRIAGTTPILSVGTDFGMFILSAVLLAAARDALSKYYARTGHLLGRPTRGGV